MLAICDAFNQLIFTDIFFFVARSFLINFIIRYIHTYLLPMWRLSKRNYSFICDRILCSTFCTSFLGFVSCHVSYNVDGDLCMCCTTALTTNERPSFFFFFCFLSFSLIFDSFRIQSCVWFGHFCVQFRTTTKKIECQNGMPTSSLYIKYT